MQLEAQIKSDQIRSNQINPNLYLAELIVGVHPYQAAEGGAGRETGGPGQGAAGAGAEPGGGQEQGYHGGGGEGLGEGREDHR